MKQSAKRPRGPIFVGVDGGATWIRVFLVDRLGAELAAVQGPTGATGVRPASSHRPAADAVATRIEELVRRAANQGGCADALPARGLLAGFSGAGSPEYRSALHEALCGTDLAAEVRVTTDINVAYMDAFATQPGMLLISGTGSILVARNEAGSELRVGGWGPLLGDEGSGYWIGMAAIRAVMKALDGRGPTTGLGEDLVQAAGVAGPRGLPAWCEASARWQISALAPRVLEQAEDGDEVADEIRRAALRALLEHLEAGRTHLEMTSPAFQRTPAVALAGGLLEPGGGLRADLEEALPRLGLLLRPGQVRPERGAAAKALELFGA